MSHKLPQVIWIFTALSSLHFGQIAANCPRCARIEEEREREQAANPQPFQYYDERVGLHKEEKPSEAPVKAPSSQSQPLSAIFESHLDSYLLADASTQASTNSGKAPQPFFEENIPGFNEVGEPKPAETKPEAAVKQNYFSTIFTIFKTKDFLETLDGSFTLLIPTNEALQKLPPGTLESLAKPENAEKLAQLVSNHLIPRKILKKDFEENNNKEIKAISGRNLTLDVKNKNLRIDEANIILIEPAGYDGVIFLIDRVLQ